MIDVRQGFLIVLSATLAASAATVTTIEQVARAGQTPPGRTGVGLTRLFGIPSINDSGVMVFVGFSSTSTGANSAAGIYVKEPGQPLDVLVDTTGVSGVPTFAVPGRPAGTFFGTFKNPIINNNGDVLFHASITGGDGFYVVNVGTRVITKIVDNVDPVPGFPAIMFKSFNFLGTASARVLASLNDAGGVVFFGRFDRPGFSFESVGLYGSTVAGGTPLLLADNTGTVLPADQSVPFQEVRDEAAINNNGIVVFQGAVGPSSTVRSVGIFSIPVDGSAAATTVALQGQIAPGTGLAFTTSFDRADVNDAGTVVFRHRFGSGSSGLYAGDVNGGPLSRVVDSSFAVPGKTGATFDDIQFAPINESGQLGFMSTDNATPANNGGMHATDTSGGAPTLLINTFAAPPPGRTAPAILQAFEPLFQSPPINDSGNIALAGNGATETGTVLFGLYFYDACAQTLDRVADESTASSDLGGTFSTTGDRRFAIHTGFTARSGHMRSLNQSNELAVFVSFSNFDGGIYRAEMSAGGGGGVEITCPADVVAECPADTTPAGSGTAGAVDSCTGAAVAVTFNDATLAGCGATETITRTWSADDGNGGTVSCDQIIAVGDTIAPSITCPADVIVECDASTDPIDTGMATASDACDPNPTVGSTDTSAGLTCPQESVQTRTWTAADACGNATSCDQSITIVDTTAPVLSVDTTPIEVVDVDCSGDEAVVLPQATATDNCDSSVDVSDDRPAAFAAGETTSVTFTATDDCQNSESAVVDVSVKHGATISVKVLQLSFDFGSRPVVMQDPIVGVEVFAFSRPGSEFCSHHLPNWHGWHWWRHVVLDCDESPAVNSAITDSNGIANIDVPPGNYLVVTFFDFDDDPGNDHFLGHPVFGLQCGDVRKANLRLIITPRGKRLAAKIRRFSGSELIVSEPDMMIWDDVEQEYPYGLESEGEWGVTVTVEPPEGFIADNESLSATVATEMDALQFTVTEVGSDLVPTRTTLNITHDGERIDIDSSVGIRLTPDYARSRGFDVHELRRLDLIHDRGLARDQSTSKVWRERLRDRMRENQRQR